MRAWIGRSLQRKLSFITLISTLVPLLSLGVFTYLISSQTTEQKLKQSGIDTLRQMEANLRFMMNDIENLSVFLIGQTDIQQYLTSPDANESLRARINGFMTDLASSKKYISNITIYPDRSAPFLTTSTIYESGLADLVDLRLVRDKMWTGLYPIHDYAGEHQVITFIRPLRSIYNYANLGWLLISLSEEEISKYWSDPNLGGGRGEVALLNEKGEVLSATVKEWLARPFAELHPGMPDRFGSGKFGDLTYGEGGDRKTILYYRVSSSGWLLVGTIPHDLSVSQNRYILQLTGAAVIVAILINVGLVLFVIQRVTGPLRILTRLLAKVDPEAPLPLYPASTADEIGMLADSYNKLGQHIRELKVRLIRDETRKKEADLRALQAQINPHFLYNTLSSVHWMALMSGETKISDMVGALADFLQFSLNKGKDFCPVHQEIAHVKNYVQIQSIRYPDKFDVDFSVDPELKDTYMLKLLLQPLIENAMIHGIQKKEGKGKIAVYLERKNREMHVLVMDDGVGMDSARLEAVRRGLEPGEGEGEGSRAGYGLRNVNERLRLHYGPDSRLELDSQPNGGTRIVFSIPILEEPR